MITKVFELDFEHQARTLNWEEVSDVEVVGIFEKTHPSGWTIRGRISEDYYYWVNEFEAVHPLYGKVFGDFENVVYHDSEEGYEHFYNNHTPEHWDYQDI